MNDPIPTPLTDTEKAYFDTIKQVTRSARPEDLSLRRMLLTDPHVAGPPRDVAVVVQRIVSSDDASTVGWQPLAMLLDDETATRLRGVDGKAPDSVNPDDVEGAA